MDSRPRIRYGVGFLGSDVSLYHVMPVQTGIQGRCGATTLRA